MSTYQTSAGRSSRSSDHEDDNRKKSKKPLDPASDKALDIWERQNEIRMDDEEDLDLRAKTQTVAEAIPRYMGENFTAPVRYALGLIGAGEVEQVVEEKRPVAWMQNAPGPKELDRTPSDQARQQAGAEEATNRQRLIDQTRQFGEPGGSVLTPPGGVPDGDGDEGPGTLAARDQDRDEDDGEEFWMQRLITEKAETIDEQAETIRNLVHQLDEEEEDEEFIDRDDDDDDWD